MIYAWGADPGTANAALVRIADDVVDIVEVSKLAATKGSKRNPPKVARFRLRVWRGLRISTEVGQAGRLTVNHEAAVVDTTMTTLLYDGVDAIPYSAAEIGLVERILGNVHPDLAEAAGFIRGILAWRTDVEPNRVTSTKWRKAMLDLPSTTPAREAERIAVERVREEVAEWPADASAHAAEAYWIARCALEGGR